MKKLPTAQNLIENLFKKWKTYLNSSKKDNLIWMKHFKNTNIKYIFTHIIAIMRIKERFVCSLIEENNPPKMVIIVTRLDIQFKKFNWGIPKGFNLSSTTKNNEFNIKIKKALFWYEIGASPTFTREITKIVTIFLKRKTNSLKK